MQILRLLNRQTRSPWARVQASSKPSYCGKSVVCQRKMGQKSMHKTKQLTPKAIFDFENVCENI